MTALPEQTRQGREELAAPVFIEIRSQAEWVRALGGSGPVRDLERVSQVGALGLPSGAAQMIAEALREVGGGLGAYHAGDRGDIWGRSELLSNIVAWLERALSLLEDAELRGELPSLAALLRGLLEEVFPRAKYLSAVARAYGAHPVVVIEIPMDFGSGGGGVSFPSDGALLPEGITEADMSAAIHPRRRALGVMPHLRDLFDKWRLDAMREEGAPPFWIWLETR